MPTSTPASTPGRRLHPAAWAAGRKATLRTAPTIALGAALGLATLAAPGCSSPAAQTQPTTAPPAASVKIGASPTTNNNTTAATASPATPSCPDVSVYTVDGADPADVPKGVCLRVGARLRIENTFPNATADPPGLATCVYEAGIVNCLLTNPGSVSITWGQAAEQRSTTILVVP